MYDPEELYQETDLQTMERWIDACVSASTVPVTRGGTEFTEREREFITSVHKQFEDKRKEGRKKPLSGKQLAWLRSLYDKT